MLRLLYNIALLILVLIYLPKWLWEALRYKKHRRSFLEKLGFHLPEFVFTKKGPRIWIHSISMGETKAAIPLIKQLQDSYPTASIVISTITETGYVEAGRVKVDHTFYLPLDFSWTIRKLMHRIKPDLLILVEGDFWFNLIDLAPRIVLVNGKISEKSLARFKKVPFFSKRLFGKIELFCLQSERFKDRFLKLGIDPKRLIVTGNLKFDQQFLPIDKTKWQDTLGISSSDRVLTLGSTHDPEEELLLDALAPLLQKFPQLKILVVPRHPERFSQVATLLEKKGIDYNRFSDPVKNKEKRVILVDAMGVLSACYQLSEIAIVGGSFMTRLGGHNIFEPAALGVPVLFGPSMYSQKDLVELVTQAGAGRAVTIENVATEVEKLLSSPSRSMHEAGLKLANEMHGSTSRTFQALSKLLGVR
ncbi:MAG: 3-deoxy-D-manno-octulosonic acid transferase [Rhabdochlamydiaceae bacterium]